MGAVSFRKRYITFHLNHPLAVRDLLISRSTKDVHIGAWTFTTQRTSLNYWTLKGSKYQKGIYSFVAFLRKSYKKATACSFFSVYWKKPLLHHVTIATMLKLPLILFLGPLLQKLLLEVTVTYEQLAYASLGYLPVVVLQNPFFKM